MDLNVLCVGNFFSGLIIVLKLPLQHIYFVSPIVLKVEKYYTFFDCLFFRDVKERCTPYILGLLCGAASSTVELEVLNPVSPNFQQDCPADSDSVEVETAPHFFFRLNF